MARQLLVLALIFIALVGTVSAKASSIPKAGAAGHSGSKGVLYRLISHAVPIVADGVAGGTDVPTTNNAPTAAPAAGQATAAAPAASAPGPAATPKR